MTLVPRIFESGIDNMTKRLLPLISILAATTAVGATVPRKMDTEGLRKGTSSGTNVPEGYVGRTAAASVTFTVGASGIAVESPSAISLTSGSYLVWGIASLPHATSVTYTSGVNALIREISTDINYSSVTTNAGISTPSNTLLAIPMSIVLVPSGQTYEMGCYVTAFYSSGSFNTAMCSVRTVKLD